MICLLILSNVIKCKKKKRLLEKGYEMYSGCQNLKIKPGIHYQEGHSPVK